jgi:hypothetical protein
MDFVPLSPSHLTQQRQALEKAEYAFKNHKQWLQKREEIEKQILQFQQEIEIELFKKYQKGELDQVSEEFHHALEKKRHQISQLKQAQQQIDEQLDQIEHLSEESLYQLRFHLLHMIWQLYPEKRIEQEAKWQEWNHLRVLEVDVFSIEKMLERLVEHLNIAMKTRQSIKGKGIFNYIFGLSPNSVIEKQLMGMQRLIESASSLFEKALQYSPDQSLTLLLENLRAWLEKLKITCNKPWSFRHIDILFAETIPLLDQFIRHLREQQERLAFRIHKLDQDIRNWTQEETT